jgi:DNA-directed RNA polymerase subunit M/transcription elongation factor TFIIS|tara:strand:+ start:121 stop:468 length:348 start_codon:yes stop_codon:yes gene_type:complete
MDFCKLCDNMMYVKVEQDELINYCKNCNYSENIDSNESMIIIENNYEKKEMNIDASFNNNIKYDPTLPRVNNIKCPNKICIKDKDKDDEVIYTKYDKENMKYRYYCVHCDYYWNN